MNNGDAKPGTVPDLRSMIEAISVLSENMKAIYRQQCQSERVIMFMDNSNFFGSVGRVAKDLGHKFRVDYPKMYNLLLRGRFAIHAFCYYNEWDTDADTTRQRRCSYQSLLEKAGFSLVRLQRSGVSRDEGVDSTISRAMRLLAKNCPRCDTFILIAGNGNYAGTIQDIRQQYGVKVEVAFFATDTAATLREAAARFIDLDGLREQIRLDRPFTE